MKNNILTIRNMTLGSGIPKICVPIVEITDETILAAAVKAAKSSADLVEWRCDHYERLQEGSQTQDKNQTKEEDRRDVLECVKEILERIRQVLGDKPLLFTYRTKAEGGASSEEISPEDYEELNRAAIRSGCVDLIDMELRMGRAMAERLGEAAHEKGVLLLISYHDFYQTPSKEFLLGYYKTMEQWGGDVLKTAVMPRNTEEVRTLMEACQMASKQCSRPVIGISMGSLGVESRIRGREFGSAMTFGCLDKTSAPGQIEVEELRKELI